MKKSMLILVILTAVLISCGGREEIIKSPENNGPDKIKLMDIQTSESQSTPQPVMTTTTATSTPDTTTFTPEAVAPNKNDAQLAGNEATSTEEYLIGVIGAVLKTNQGDIQVEFYKGDAPQTVANFIKLAEMDFYDGVKFHRVIKNFMIQSGDPNSKDDNWADDGMGGPGYKFDDEINARPLVRGSLAMANAGANTNGSQFFIVTAESTPWLDGKHTNFGQVTQGLDVVMQIQEVEINENHHPTQDVVIEDVEILKEETKL